MNDYAGLCVGHGKSSGAFAFAGPFLWFFLLGKQKKEQLTAMRMLERKMLSAAADSMTLKEIAE